MLGYPGKGPNIFVAKRGKKEEHKDTNRSDRSDQTPSERMYQMLCDNNTAKLLGLEDVIVEEVYDNETEIHVNIRLPRKEHICPVCGERTNSIHDYRRQTVRDIPAFGKKTFLHLLKRRYRCRKCDKRFAEINPFLPRYHQVTGRLITKIIDDFRKVRPAKQIAEENGVSVTSSLRYFGLVNYFCRSLPEVLSIDEFKGNAGGEKFQSILTDPKNKVILDILPNRKSVSLQQYFRKFKERDQVRVVVMDMNRAYLEVARTCFPNAVIVIDKYHVSRQAVWAFENVRKAEQKKFHADRRKYFKRSRSLLNKHPSQLTEEETDEVAVMLRSSRRLAKAYLLKNKFQEFMRSRSSDEARERLSDWSMLAHSYNIPEFDNCFRAVNNWSKYILNSFDCPYTNGYTEGCNNKTKVLKRVCYGVRNFERFRNRILHASAA